MATYKDKVERNPAKVEQEKRNALKEFQFLKDIEAYLRDNAEQREGWRAEIYGVDADPFEEQ